MIVPIRAYGDPVLRKKCEEISPDYDKLASLLANMFETMDASDGVGLAAPQIGVSMRLFVIDSTPMQAEGEKDKGIRTAFINPIIVDQEGTPWPFEEGCLSIPGIRENVLRPPSLHITYFNEKFEKIEATFDGLTARVIQHEYDHIEGILFTDHLSVLKKQLIKGKLASITKGKVNVHYAMKFPRK